LPWFRCFPGFSRVSRRNPSLLFIFHLSIRHLLLLLLMTGGGTGLLPTQRTLVPPLVFLGNSNFKGFPISKHCTLVQCAKVIFVV
jgi:hypothetical protein